MRFIGGSRKIDAPLLQNGDRVSLNQICYLAPNSGPGDFGSLQEISPNGLPRVSQFSARFTFWGVAYPSRKRLFGRR
jgi:hypothetical protein